MVQLAGGDFFVEVHVGVDGTADQVAGRADSVVCDGVADVGEDAIEAPVFFVSEGCGYWLCHWLLLWSLRDVRLRRRVDSCGLFEALTYSSFCNRSETRFADPRAAVRLAAMVVEHGARFLFAAAQARFGNLAVSHAVFALVVKAVSGEFVAIEPAHRLVLLAAAAAFDSCGCQ